MKKLLLYTVFIFSAVCGYAQNLVPNGSFEQYSSCPNSTGQLSNTGNWNWAGATTDYYDSCSPQGNMSVPLNIYGYQYAFEGSAYIGMNVYAINESGSPFYAREPAQTAMNNSLSIGTKYFVSFKVALTLNNFESCCATNKLGARFTTFSYTDANGSNPAPIDNFAHIYSNSIVTDTVNWTTISGSFVADSAYSYITIGNFFDSTHLQIIDYFGNFPQTSAAYYFVDDVRVSTDSLYTVTSLPKFDYTNELNIYPNPSNGLIKIKAQQSNSTYFIRVFNSLGQEVFNHNVIETNSLDLTFLVDGFYNIVITNTKEQYSTKLIIQK